MKRLALVAGCAALSFAWPAAAQTVTLGGEGVTQADRLGRAFQTFSIFGGTPGIAAARYDSDFSINSFQLPISHSFAPIGSGLFAGATPYAELTLGYLTADQTFPLVGTNAPRSVKLSFDSWSALAGAGLDFPLGDGFKIRPMVLAGYSYVSANADFYGPNAATFRSLVRGVLDDATLHSVLLGGALQLSYETRLPGDIAVGAQVRYNELVSLVTSASSRYLDGDGSFGVATAGVDFDGPTGWQLGAKDIRWIGYTRGTWLPDTDPGVLGFNAFAEIGGGLRIIAPDVVRGVRGATVRASVIAGPGVTGWLVSAALVF